LDDFHHPRPEAIDGYKSGCNCQGRREVLLYPLFAKKSEATGVIMFDIILIITFVSPIVAMRLLARRFLGRLHLDEESEKFANI
jgi:hypothetical protein